MIISYEGLIYHGSSLSLRPYPNILSLAAIKAPQCILDNLHILIYCTLVYLNWISFDIQQLKIIIYFVTEVFHILV